MTTADALFVQIIDRYPSAAAAARAIGISRQALHLLTTGRNTAADGTICRAARLLDLDPARTLLDYRASTADDSDARATWASIAAAHRAPAVSTPPEDRSRAAPDCQPDNGQPGDDCPIDIIKTGYKLCEL